jgi:hypothetical protein
VNTDPAHIEPIFWVSDEQFPDQILGLPGQSFALINLFIINFVLLIESSLLFMVFGVEQFVACADIVKLDPDTVLVHFWSIIFGILFRIVHNKRTHVSNGTAVVPGVFLAPVIFDESKINQFYDI